MMKKFSFLITVIILVSTIMTVGAAEPVLDLSFEHKLDFPTTDAAGSNGWLYQYNPGETYADYTNMEWNPAGTSYVRRDGNGNVDNFVSKWSMHPGGPGPTAIVWVAPTSGRVRLTTNGGVCKSSDKGSEVFASIIHTDKSSANPQKLWYKTVEGNDITGTENTYKIETDVKVGDKIYFEIDCNTTASAGTVWNPQVTYLKTIMFSTSEKKLATVSEISNGEVVKCTFFQDDVMLKEEYAYAVVYDKQGRLRAASEPQRFLLSSTEKECEVSVNMPVLSENEKYDGWQISLITLTSDTGRFYPTADLGELSLN